jgi:hypothetical protein
MGVAWRARELVIVYTPVSGWCAGQGGGGIQVSMRCIEGRQCTAPTRLCTWTRAVLRRGLHVVLSAMSAQPAERAMRGFIAELLARYLV